MAKDIETPKDAKDLPAAVARQMLNLTTSGFGLVAALAWNEVVKDAIENYVKPYLPAGSGFLSRLLYAIIITSLAVLVTLQLTKIQEIFETEEEKKAKLKKSKKKKAKKK